MSLKGIGISSVCFFGLALATSACSDDGTTYVIYAGGSAGMVGSGASTSSGGAASGGASSGGAASGGASSGGAASGGSDPGSGGQVQTGGSAGAPPGGSSSSGGAGAGGPGGSGNQSGSGNNGGSSGGGVQTPVTLIDDFADCDGNIIEIDGRKGVWYNLNSSASNTMSVGPAPEGWTPGCGVFLVGSCSGCDAAGLAVILAAGTYDLSRFQGISVTFESEATLYVAVKTTNGSSYGYSRSSEVLGTGSGGTRTIYFSSMTPDASFHGLNWAQEVHFTIDDYSKELGYGLGITRLELIP